MEIIDNDDKPENTVEEILSNKNEDEISIIHSDFEREEMGILSLTEKREIKKLNCGFMRVYDTKFRVFSLVVVTRI